MTRAFILSGPSAAGKTTISRAAAERCDMLLGVSHTTRPQRPGEQTGRDYFFVPEREFDWLERIGAFLEHVTYPGSGYRYGFMRKFWAVAQLLGRDLIAVMEPHGMAMVREALGAENVVSIFITPPKVNDYGYEQLARRMSERGDEVEAIARRLADARRMVMESASAYDYTVPNADGELDAAIEAVCRIVRGVRTGLEVVG